MKACETCTLSRRVEVLLGQVRIAMVIVGLVGASCFAFGRWALRHAVIDVVSEMGGTCCVKVADNGK